MVMLLINLINLIKRNSKSTLLHVERIKYSLLELNLLFIVIVLISFQIVIGNMVDHVDYLIWLKEAVKINNHVLTGVPSLNEIYHILYVGLEYLACERSWNCTHMNNHMIADALLYQGMLVIAFFLFSKKALFRNNKIANILTLVIYSLFSSLVWVPYVIDSLLVKDPNTLLVIEKASNIGLTWSFTGTQIREFRSEHLAQFAYLVALGFLSSDYGVLSRLVWISAGFLAFISHSLVEPIFFSLFLLIVSIYVNKNKIRYYIALTISHLIGILLGIGYVSSITLLLLNPRFLLNFINYIKVSLIIFLTIILVTLLNLYSTSTKDRGTTWLKFIPVILIKISDWITLSICKLANALLLAFLVMFIRWVIMASSGTINYEVAAGQLIPILLHDFSYILGLRLFLFLYGVIIHHKKNREYRDLHLRAFIIYSVIIFVCAYLLYFVNNYVVDTFIQPKRVLAVFGSFSTAPVAAIGFLELLRRSRSMPWGRLLTILVVIFVLLSSTFSLVLRVNYWSSEYQFRNKLLIGNNNWILETGYWLLKHNLTPIIASAVNIPFYFALITIPYDILASQAIINTLTPFPLLIELSIKAHYYAPNYLIVLEGADAYKHKYLDFIRKMSFLNIEKNDLKLHIVDLKRYFLGNIPILSDKANIVFIHSWRNFSTIDYYILHALITSGLRFTISRPADPYIYGNETKILIINEEDINVLHAFTFDIEKMLSQGKIIIVIGNGGSYYSFLSKHLSISVPPSNVIKTTLGKGKLIYVPRAVLSNKSAEYAISLVKSVILASLNKNFVSKEENLEYNQVLDSMLFNISNIIRAKSISILDAETNIIFKTIYLSRWGTSKDTMKVVFVLGNNITRYYALFISLNPVETYAELKIKERDYQIHGVQGVYALIGGVNRVEIDGKDFQVYLVDSNGVEHNFTLYNVSLIIIEQPAEVMVRPLRLHIKGAFILRDVYLRSFSSELLRLCGDFMCNYIKIKGTLELTPIILDNNNVYFAVDNLSYKSYTNNYIENTRRLLRLDIDNTLIIIASIMIYSIKGRRRKNSDSGVSTKWV